MEGSDFLLVFLFDLDMMDNCRYQIDNPARPTVYGMIFLARTRPCIKHPSSVDSW